MDSLSKNLFNDFELEVEGFENPQFASPPSLKRCLPRPNVHRFELEVIRENSSSAARNREDDGSPKSSDSLIDELGSIDDFVSPSKFSCSPDQTQEQPSFNCSPPSLNKGFLALKLFDTPHTPKTLFTKSKRGSKEDSQDFCPPSPLVSDRIKARGSLRLRERLKREDRNINHKKRGAVTDPRPQRTVVYANVNPFTPDSDVQVRAKRPRIYHSRYQPFFGNAHQLFPPGQGWRQPSGN